MRLSLMLLGLTALGLVTTGCGASDDLDGLDDHDVTILREGGELRARMNIDTPHELFGTKPSCPTIAASVGVDGAPLGPRKAYGGTGTYRTKSLVFGGEGTSYSCGEIELAAPKALAPKTLLVIKDDHDNVWNLEIVEQPDRTPFAITRASEGPVREGDDVELVVSPVPEGLEETTILMSSVTAPARWLALDRLVFTMPAIPLVQPRDDLHVEVSFKRTFTPRVTQCDGPRSCRFGVTEQKPIELTGASAEVVMPFTR